MKAAVSNVDHRSVVNKISRAVSLALALGVLSVGNAIAVDPNLVQPVEPLGGSFVLPKPPTALCPTVEKQCLRKCPPSNPSFVSYCALGCALERANCDSGFTAFGSECNAPKGSHCL